MSNAFSSYHRQRHRALSRDRDVARRRALAVVGLLGIAVALAVGYRQLRRAPLCRGAVQKLAGAWDSARQRAMTTAFTATTVPYAANALRSVTRVLDGYARDWAAMYTEACEATRVRGEQSDEALDLRMQCLSERLGNLKATTDLFVAADGKTVERALTAASSLPPIDRCADVAALRVPTRAPSDPGARARVDALRVELATATALEKAGRYRDSLTRATSVAAGARALRYRPLEAEALRVQGDDQEVLGDYDAARASLLDSVAAAEAGRHESLEVLAWASLIWQAAHRGHFAEGHEHAKHGQACLERVGGDERLAEKLERAIGSLLIEEHRYEEARLHSERALALAEKRLGPDDPEVGKALIDLGNIALCEGRYEEARRSQERALAVAERTMGATHPNAVVPSASLVLHSTRLSLVPGRELFARRFWRRRQTDMWNG